MIELTNLVKLHVFKISSRFISSKLREEQRQFSPAKHFFSHGVSQNVLQIVSVYPFVTISIDTLALIYNSSNLENHVVCGCFCCCFDWRWKKLAIR